MRAAIYILSGIFMCLVIGGMFLFIPTKITKPENPPEITKYNNIAAIPDILRDELKANTYEEQYLQRILHFVRKQTHTGTYLSQEDVDNAIAEDLQKKLKQAENILQYDTNLDGFVDIEKEIIKIISSDDQNKADDDQSGSLSSIDKYKKLDSNKDGQLSYDEIITLSDADKRSIENSVYKKYMALDPNQDGKLEDAELRALAITAFSTLDLNNDKKISHEEYELLQEFRKSTHDVPDSCVVPPISEQTQLTAIGIYDGTSLSTVTIAGQEEVTTTIRTIIDPENRPTYLILTSHTPIIWNFHGNLNSIQHVLVSNSPDNESEKSSSGVVGIPKEKVTFVHSECVPYFYKIHDTKGVKAKSSITQLMNKEPDTFTGHYDAGAIAIKNKVVEFSKMQRSPQDRNKALTPEGYDEQLWPKVLHFYPDGITQIDPAKVVSEQPAETYVIMPQSAGIAQLIQENKIVRYDPQKDASSVMQKRFAQDPREEAFRIIRNIPHYPPGLAGAHSVNFIISKGVKPPEDLPGHSCVIMEETGEILSSVGLCR